MPHARMLLDEEHAKAWLKENGVDVDADTLPNGVTKNDLEAIILVRKGMASGQPSVFLALRVDGRIRLAETSLQLLETATSGMRAASGVARDP